MRVITVVSPPCLTPFNPHSDESSPLHSAAATRNLRMVRFLVGSGADVNKVDR
jgi:ankyrin repeat protein